MIKLWPRKSKGTGSYNQHATSFFTCLRKVSRTPVDLIADNICGALIRDKVFGSSNCEVVLSGETLLIPSLSCFKITSSSPRRYILV